MTRDDIRPFVVLNEATQSYEVVADTAAWLQTRVTPFAVLACAGKFRTGKSFLLNRLLRFDPGKGFGVGDTVQACTRGIWVSTRLMQTPNGEREVLVLDTEGIDALDAESEHDVRVFALSVLMCSAFAYNSMSHLDEAAVQTLSLMTRVAEALQDASHNPHLYWILRDFSLQLVDSSGNAMTHTEYLEQALEPPTTSAKCETRAAIRRIFSERRLVTLPRPQRGDSAQRLEHKSPSALTPKFERYLETMRVHICENTPPVTAAGVPMTGRVYVEHVRNLVQGLNDGNIPKIEDSWALLSKLQQVEAETMARDELLNLAEADCPVGSDAVVKAWVANVCAKHELRRMPTSVSPADEKKLRDNVCNDVLRHVKALGRVRNVSEMARELAASSLEEFDATLDMTCIDRAVRKVEIEQDETFLALFNRAILQGLTPVWQKASSSAMEKGRSQVVDEMHCARARLDAELETLRATVRDMTHIPPPCQVVRDVEDASTCTDEDGISPETNTQFANDLDVARENAELEARVTQAEARASDAEVRCVEIAKREKESRAAFEEYMESLASETKEKLDAARSEVATATSDAAAARHQLSALTAECDKLRGLARDAQESTVQMHKTSLEELRRRDVQQREILETHLKAQSEIITRSETATIELRAVKRRNDELLSSHEDCKRMRSELQQLQITRARGDAEREALRVRAQASAADVETVREYNLTLERRLAVLEASMKLETCRRALE